MPTTEQTVTPALDLTYVRSQFPSLAQTVNGHPAAFLDGPGGTQVPQRVIDAIANYLRRDNANTGGAYATSRRTDAMIAEARSAMADFLHCGADEVVFGPNMTTLTYAMSRAIGRDLRPGDEIVVTRLDHDANVSPWLQMAEDQGLTVRWAEIHDEDCTLDMADLASKINSNTKLVAAGYASNAVGTINPVKEIVRLAHAAGALAYIDAVHYGPHGLIDVAALDCDFLVCSTYKFFGPHMGVLFGKREHLKRLRPYKVRPEHQRNSQLLGVGHAQPRMHRRHRRLRGISSRPRPPSRNMWGRNTWSRAPRPSVERSSTGSHHDPPRRHRKPPTKPSTNTSAPC